MSLAMSLMYDGEVGLAESQVGKTPFIFINQMRKQEVVFNPWDLRFRCIQGEMENL